MNKPFIFSDEEIEALEEAKVWMIKWRGMYPTRFYLYRPLASLINNSVGSFCDIEVFLYGDVDTVSGELQKHHVYPLGLGFIGSGRIIKAAPEKAGSSAVTLQKECFMHDWKTYIGLQESFDYCGTCDEKRKS